MTPLPSAFTLSMKRSKFFENWVFSAKDVTALSVTSCAVARLAAAAVASASSAASTVVVFMMSPPDRRSQRRRHDGRLWGDAGPRNSMEPGALLQEQPLGAA